MVPAFIHTYCVQITHFIVMQSQLLSGQLWSQQAKAQHSRTGALA